MASSARDPRATVFSRIGRSERPSLKKSDGDSGRCFGCNAMSCFRLHPASTTTHAVPQTTFHTRAIEARRRRSVIMHLAHVARIDALQKSRRFPKIELLIARLDAQEKAVRGGVLRKSLDVKERVIRL